MRISDWSSDVCSSDLPTPPAGSFATAGADMTERQAVAREEVALPLVEVEDLSKIFDVSPPLLNRLLQGQGRALLTAVDHVSFRIPRGTTFSLVGESGCGKSTVARLLVGLPRPSGGPALSPDT